MNNYGEKLDYLFKHQKWKCPICNLYMSYQEPLDLHHRAHNHKWRRKRFPLFIDSLLNLQLVHSGCHLTKNMGSGKISDLQAEKWEKFLQKHKKLEKFVNCPCVMC